MFGWFSPAANEWLVAPRVFQWGSRAVRYLPGQAAASRAHEFGGTVIVVGAGAAGLAAAKALEDSVPDSRGH